MSAKDHPKVMQYLEEVVQGIKSSKDGKKVVEHDVGWALENHSHGQQSAVAMLQQRYTEVHQSGK
jgi:hypothetical protein